MAKEWTRYVVALVVAMTLIVASPGTAVAGPAGGNAAGGRSATSTPIKHLVVIFQENESFDHYFGTYPFAANPPGETEFHARPDTPSVNGLTDTLLTHNPNGPTAEPFRLDPSQNYTCDQTHYYTPEQQAFDAGLMDKFPQYTGKACAEGTYPNVAS